HCGVGNACHATILPAGGGSPWRERVAPACGAGAAPLCRSLPAIPDRDDGGSMQVSRALFDDRDGGLRGKLIALSAIRVAANLGAWGWAFAAFHGNPVLLGAALLAYGLGLRHAVDADHIAAIDNTTRKLMQEGKRPLGVGFFFALGHSTVVIVA